MKSFLVACPDFEPCLLNWMIKTYQPLQVSECEEFRMLCKSLNKRSPEIGHDRLGGLLKNEYYQCQLKMTSILKGRHYALTTDAWTSIAKVGYVTCTAHFIDRHTWKLHSVVLGLYEKTGRSRAIDCVEYAEKQMEVYNLEYPYMSCVVTDTEATMVAAGRLFVENAENRNGKAKWHGCIDHLLELVTGLAFSDTPESLGAMSACRSLINFFKMLLLGGGAPFLWWTGYLG